MGFNAFKAHEGDTILRGSALTTDGVAMLVTRSPSKNQILVLLSFLGKAGDGYKQTVGLQLNDIPIEILELQWERSIPSPDASFAFQVQERGTLEVVDGSIYFPFVVSTPSVRRLELSW